MNTPLNMDSLHKEVVNLLFQNKKLATSLHRKSTFSGVFTRHFLTSRNKEQLRCESKYLKVSSEAATGGVL